MIRLRINLIMENCRDFFDVFQETAGQAPGTILLDFSVIRFIDSSGIGILLKCVEKSKADDIPLFIHGLNRQLEQVFKLAGLLKVFEILDDNEVKQRYPELEPHEG